MSKFIQPASAADSKVSSGSTLGSLSKEQTVILRDRLSLFLDSCSAHWVAIADRGGNLLVDDGKDPGTDITILCALAAGSFAASKELARRLNAREFLEQVHEGEGPRILIRAIDEELIVIVLFQRGTSIGLVRYYSAKLAANLAALIVQWILHPGATELPKLDRHAFETTRPLLR